MAKKCIQLHDDKTDVIVLGPPPNHSIASHLGPLTLNPHAHARNIGVIFNSVLKFDKQINPLEKGFYLQMRNIAKLKSIRSLNNMNTVTSAWISSRLDYSNSLYMGITQSSLSYLQLVQNAETRLITATRETDIITVVLASLHWIPVKNRIEFRVLVFLKPYMGWHPCKFHNFSGPTPSWGLLDPKNIFF